jgi:thiamine transport system permease protein
VLPTLVVATAFSALLGPRGWLNLGLMQLFDLSSPPIHFVNSLAAILVAHVFYNTTIVIRMVGDFWARLNPRIEQAARALGASPWQTFRRVTLPLLSPALAAAALLVFIFDFTSFGVILVLGGPQFATLEVEIYYQTVSLFNLPTAAVLSLLQLASTLGLTLVYTRLSARLSRPVDVSAPERSARPLQGPARWLAGAWLAALLVFFAMPLFGLAARSVTRLDAERQQRTEVQTGLTLDYYAALGEDPQSSIFYAPPAEAIRNSLGYAAATVLLALTIGMPAAWLLARRAETLYSRLLDPLLMLPLGTSAVTLGLGFLIALDQPPLDLRASPLLVPLAHSLVALPFVVRSLAPALRSIRPRLRQAAAVLGADAGQVLRHVGLGSVRLHDFAGRIRRYGHGRPARISDYPGADLSPAGAPRGAELWPGAGAEHDPDERGRGRHAGD